MYGEFVSMIQWICDWIHSRNERAGSEPLYPGQGRRSWYRWFMIAAAAALGAFSILIRSLVSCSIRTSHLFASSPVIVLRASSAPGPLNGSDPGRGACWSGELGPLLPTGAAVAGFNRLITSCNSSSVLLPSRPTTGTGLVLGGATAAGRLVSAGAAPPEHPSSKYVRCCGTTPVGMFRTS